MKLLNCNKIQILALLIPNQDFSNIPTPQKINILNHIGKKIILINSAGIKNMDFTWRDDENKDGWFSIYSYTCRLSMNDCVWSHANLRQFIESTVWSVYVNYVTKRMVASTQISH